MANVATVQRGFGALKADFFATIPRRSREPDLVPSEIQRRADECKVILEQMRAEAYRDKSTGKLNDVHTLTFELQLTLGEQKAALDRGAGGIVVPGR